MFRRKSGKKRLFALQFAHNLRKLPEMFRKCLRIHIFSKFITKKVQKAVDKLGTMG